MTAWSWRVAASGAFVGATAFGAAALAQDETVMALDEAPGEALAAAQAKAPDVTFETVSVEVEDGVTTYEFGGKGTDGGVYEVDVAQWYVLEIEQMIGADAVPAEVFELVQIQLPGFAPTTIEKSDHLDGVIVYEFEGVDGDGGAVDIEVQADGESIIVLDDEES
ncbi:MAG: hypothetical protein MI723_08385 [Caulobacterales bacterium]|nr:hypothetical protein [Caulobacterales bacterium]